jgi:uncharacterized secreted protein with C-terminal beta-propeller domain
MSVHCSVFNISSRLKSSKEHMFYVVSVYMLPTFNEHFFTLNYFMDILILVPENIYI